MHTVDKTETDGAEPELCLFCQLNEFDNVSGKWFEKSRWVKFEEVVENTHEHWSKPHIGVLQLTSIFSLKHLLAGAVISLGQPGDNLDTILGDILAVAMLDGLIDEATQLALHNMLYMKHLNPHHYKAGFGSQHSLFKNTVDLEKKLKGTRQSAAGLSTDGPENGSLLQYKFCSRFLKKIPVGSEVANILVAETPILTKNLFLIIRLSKSFVIGAYSEVSLPTRFLLFILGPEGNLNELRDCGRVTGSLFADPIFRQSAYTATSLEDLTHALDEFIGSALVIPPDQWNPETRIDPPKESIPQRITHNHHDLKDAEDEISLDKFHMPEEDTDSELKRTGRIFGGFIDDFKRKRKFYLSDFKDALNLQCLASFIFLYFACLAPIITFGGLLIKATEGYLGAIESILAAAIVGIIYALCSGQPLTILGTTGPLLIFESIVFQICSYNKWDFLSFRLWIGFWIMILLLIVVAFDLSFLVKYFTKFTEECFAMLISLIYIVKAFQNLFDLLEDYPINRYWNPNYVLNRTCSCIPPNKTILDMTNDEHTQRLLKIEKPPLLPSYKNMTNVSILHYIDWENITDGYFSWNTHVYKQICVDFGGSWVGNTCGKLYVPDIFYLSWILMLGTFVVAYGLKIFKNSDMLPYKVRETIGTFSVVLAITIFTLLDLLIGMNTPKLVVPSKFEPTLGYSTRTWIVPLLGNNPWWTTVLAIVPATLALILIFMDQQITVIIVNRKTNKLKKGYGYHLDIFIIAILIGLTSVMGLPWFVGSTVLAMNHVMSLKIESSNNVPGVEPMFLGCREQRLTHFMISLAVGLSVFFTPMLKKIPMPVLYGVFFYMGVSPLSEIEMVQRVRLIFINVKKRPDYKYLHYIPIKRVHIFTAIQVICLGLLFTIKSVNILSVTFPLMVLAMCFVRKSLECIFTREELKWLDQVFPTTNKKKSRCGSNCCNCFKGESEEEKTGSMQLVGINGEEN